MDAAVTDDARTGECRTRQRYPRHQHEQEPQCAVQHQSHRVNRSLPVKTRRLLPVKGWSGPLEPGHWPRT